jgi:hypothetical protein
MPRNLLLLLGGLSVLFIASQLAIPPIAERTVEDRLERDGGHSEVSLSAFPAVRLLFGDGRTIEVEGEGLRLDPDRRRDALERLEGFDEVSVRLEQLDAGPLDVQSFQLVRQEGDDKYETAIEATTTPRQVARFIGSEAGGVFGGVLGDLAVEGLPGGGNAEVPIDVAAMIEDRSGEVVASDVTGSVAGIPAGPLAELVVEAVARRL